MPNIAKDILIQAQDSVKDILKQNRNTYINAFTNLKSPDYWTQKADQFKSGLSAPRAIYNNFTGKIPNPSQEKEFVDTNFGNIDHGLKSAKGQTPTEFRNRYEAGVAVSKDPEKLIDFFGGLIKRKEIVDNGGVIKTEAKHLLGLALVKNLTEGRFLGYTGAIASGLVGTPLSSASGTYQALKANDLQRELDEREGRPVDTTVAHNVGRPVLAAAGGFIPGVGIFSNLYHASKRYALEDRLKESKKLNPTPVVATQENVNRNSIITK